MMKNNHKNELYRVFLVHGRDGGSHPDGFMQYDVSCTLSGAFNEASINDVLNMMIDAMQDLGLRHLPRKETTQNGRIFQISDCSEFYYYMRDEDDEAVQIVMDENGTVQRDIAKPCYISYQFRFKPDDLADVLKALADQVQIDKTALGLIQGWKDEAQNPNSVQRIRTSRAPILRAFRITF